MVSENRQKVTSTLPLRVRGVDGEQFDRLSREYSRLGQMCIDLIYKRFREFRIVPARKGTCGACNGKKNLVVERVATVGPARWCSPCFADYLYGKTAKKDIFPVVENESSIPYKTYNHLLWRKAVQLFKAWLKATWGKHLKLQKKLRVLERCRDSVNDRDLEHEVDEITRIRREWKESRVKCSPLRYFRRFYLKGVNPGEYELSKKGRWKRKQRLKKIATLREVAAEVATPVCEGCDKYRDKEWNYECEVDSFVQVDRVPSFPREKIDLSNDWHYTVKNGDLYLGLKAMGIPLWHLEKDRRPFFKMVGNKDTGALVEQLDTSTYPFLLKRRNHRKDMFFFMYPLKEEVGVVRGPWTHTVAYGDTKTMVVSIGEGEEKVVKSFRHGGVKHVKDRRENLDSAAGNPHEDGEEKRKNLKKGGGREGRMVRWVLHNETREIADYIGQMPGEVQVLAYKKKRYPRGEVDRKEKNRRLSRLNDSVFRRLLVYKLELKGLPVEEVEFPLQEGEDRKEVLAVCPYCGRELGGTWQALFISGRREVECCRNYDIFLAMADSVSPIS